MVNPSLHIRMTKDEIDALDRARAHLGLSRQAYMRLLLQVGLSQGQGNELIVASLESLAMKVDQIIRHLANGADIPLTPTEDTPKDTKMSGLVAESIGNLMDW